MRVYCNLCGTQIDAKEFIEDHAVICKACARKSIKQIMDNTQMKDHENPTTDSENYAMHNAICVCENLHLTPNFADLVLEIVDEVKNDLHPEKDADIIIEKLGLPKAMKRMIPVIIQNWRVVNDI